jgi:hypothetical protein
VTAFQLRFGNDQAILDSTGSALAHSHRILRLSDSGQERPDFRTFQASIGIGRASSVLLSHCFTKGPDFGTSHDRGSGIGV